MSGNPQQLESHLLGSLLTDVNYYKEACLKGASEELFTSPEYKIIFHCMTGLSTEGKEPSLLEVMTRLPNQLETIMALADNVQMPSQWENSLTHLQELATARELSNGLEVLRQAIEQPLSNPSSWLAQISVIHETLLSRMATETSCNAAEWLAKPEQRPKAIIENWLDAGDVAFVVGPSKIRKTFFCLQMAVSLAKGENFLGFPIPEPVRVAYFQLEVKPYHFQQRLKSMAREMNIDNGSLANLNVFNMWGLSDECCSETALKMRIAKASPHVVFIDPAYLLIGDENDQKEAKDFVKRLARITRETGAALISVFHTPKSGANGRNAIDAAAGSGVFGRSCDSQFVLSPHEYGRDYVVLQTVTRNYKGRDDCTIYFNGGCFVIDNSPAIMAKPGQRAENVGEIDAAKVGEWFAEYGETMNQTQLKNCLRENGVKSSETDLQIGKLRKAGLIVEDPQRGQRNARIFRKGEETAKGKPPAADESDIPDDIGF